jgi:hypothetical protein
MEHHFAALQRHVTRPAIRAWNDRGPCTRRSNPTMRVCWMWVTVTSSIGRQLVDRWGRRRCSCTAVPAVDRAPELGVASTLTRSAPCCSTNAAAGGAAHLPSRPRSISPRTRRIIRCRTSSASVGTLVSIGGSWWAGRGARRSHLCTHNVTPIASEASYSDRSPPAREEKRHGSHATWGACSQPNGPISRLPSHLLNATATSRPPTRVSSQARTPR